jgi:hypothetical protein
LAIRLRVEGRAHAELYARQPKEIPPDVTREHRVTVAYDGRRKPMEVDDAVEEGPGHERGCIGVTEGDEVRVLGEAVNYREDDRLAAHLGKALDEVHGDISPHL